MNTATDSPALISLPAQGPVQLLFLLLHGGGGQAADMALLSAALREQYPQAALVSLTAPLAEGAGFSWFASADLSALNLGERVAAALPALALRVRAWAQHFELSRECVALGGFAQGATMALELVQRAPQEQQLAGRVLAIAGGHAVEPEHAPRDVSLHCLQGLADTVVPYRPVVATARRLVLLGGDVTADVLPEIGHTLHPALVAKAMEQLRTFLPGRLWREAMLAAPKN